MKKTFSLKELLTTTIFSVYLFVHMSILTMINRSSTGVLDQSAHIWMYYIDQIFLVAGFILFSILWNRIKSDQGRARIIAVATILTFFPVFIMLIYPSTFAFLVLAPIVNISLGILGGAINFFISVALFETGNVGRILAISATFAYLLQYFVQILADNKILLLLLIIAGMLSITGIVKRTWEWILVECLPGSDSSLQQSIDIPRIKRAFVSLSILSIMAVCLLTYYDSQLLRLMVESDMKSITAYSWPRLFAILGYLVIGILGDFKDKRYVHIAFFILTFWLILSPVIYAENPTGKAALVLFYVVVGSSICYMYLMFMRLAPLTGRNAPLIASMGRVIEGLFGVVFSFLPWEKMGLGTLIAFGIASCSIMLATYLLNGDLYIHDRSKEEVVPVSETEEAIEDPIKEQEQEQDPEPATDTEPEAPAEPFEIFAKHYNLTEREKDVCRRLLFTEDAGQKIADDLLISRRVFQRHVASIYEKTGTKSRMGLFKAYNNSCS